jgi:hypothetical protein
MRHKKKKGEAAVCPQVHPRTTIAKLILICKVNLEVCYVGWSG